MKANGSLYVSIVLAVLVGYFSYQWWFNPSRAIKRQLGELAASLSVPPGGADEMDRLTRAAHVRNYLSGDVRIRMGPSGPDITSCDAVVAAMTAWTPPPGGWNVDFVDVQITLDSKSTARADMIVEVTTRNEATGQPAIDAREVKVGLAERDGVWVITTAEPTAVAKAP